MNGRGFLCGNHGSGGWRFPGRTGHFGLLVLLVILPVLTARAQEHMVVYDGITGLAKFTMQQDTPVVATVIRRSPADKAGIQERDRVLAINDTVVAGRNFSLNQINDMLQGKNGEAVRLTILPRGSGEVEELTLVRDPYLHLIFGNSYLYLPDSLGTFDIRELMEMNPDSLFRDPVRTRSQVFDVRPGSRAEAAGFRPGDELVSLQEEMKRNPWLRLGGGFEAGFSSDTALTVQRGDSLFTLPEKPGAGGMFEGLVSQFDHDLRSECIWLRIILDGQLSEGRTYLLNFAGLGMQDSASVFEVMRRGRVMERRTGKGLTVERRDFVYQNWDAVRIQLFPDRDQDFYIRLCSRHLRGIPDMGIISHDTLVRHDRVERMVLFGFLGSMVIIACFFVILFLALVHRQYLYFGLYILSLAAYLFVSEGYLGEFHWREGGLMLELMPLFRPIFISLAAVSFLLFGSKYLELRKLSVWWHRSMQFAIVLISIRVVVVFLRAIFHFRLGRELEEVLLITWTLSVSALPLLLLIAPAIIRIRKGKRSAVYFLIANLVLIPLALISGMSSPFSFTILTLYESVLGRILHVSGVYVGVILQILIFTVGLAERLRQDDKERKEGRERIIEQLKENERLKDKVNRELEEKVQERTREIRAQKDEIEAQKDEIEAQRDEIEAQRDLVFAQKGEITDSIKYARRIQAALLPTEEVLQEVLGDHAVFYRPRDIVSGDFYWVKKLDELFVAVVADCTGHGVPGAFMSMLGVTMLNDLFENFRPGTRPGEILDQLRFKIKEMLVQRGDLYDQKDGIDLSMILVNRGTRRLHFSGANNPLILLRSSRGGGSPLPTEARVTSGEDALLCEVKGDLQPIGVYWEETPFQTHVMDLEDGDRIFLFSDGMVDQFGGPDRKKYKFHRFRELLLSLQAQPMNVQQEALEKAFDDWRGSHEQIDDICVLGFRFETD
ncbi:MAG: SpoIIE family protein phosphatase [Bacteroidales bacterium]